MRAWLESLWYSARRPPWPLRVLSRIYAAAVRRRRWRQLHRLAVPVGRPVIVVGNITVGGTGKTPLTLWLASGLRAKGVRVGVILRGYGATAPARGVIRVEPDSDPLEVGDEALVIRRRGGPVAVARERATAARALAGEVDVILADDGLQHLGLARQFEIAVVDGQRGGGNGWLLPAGPLREPLGRLGEVDAVVINGAADAPTRARLAASAAGAGRAPPPLLHMAVRAHQVLPLDAAAGAAGLPLSRFAGQRVHAVAGLGNPRRFFDALRAVGIEVREHAFPDHHRYRAADLEFAESLPILMTEKDAVKCRAFAGPARWYVPVDAVFEDDDAQRLLTPLLRLAGA
jgi:tetraacyldisaccharide 4'-kinase